MASKKGTISVRLDDSSKRRIERAARLSRQSSGAFLGKVGGQEARRVLIEWALERWRRDEATWSELADETGLAIEEIMLAASGNQDDQIRAVDAFLASCRAIADSNDDSAFLRAAEEAAESVKAEIAEGRL